MIELIASWLTPTVLFCLLNVIIGSIFITSILKSDNKPHPLVSEFDTSVPQFTRSPSLLQRVRSFNFSFPDPFSTSESDQNSSLLQRAASIKRSFSGLGKSGMFHPGPYEEEEAPKVEVEIVKSHVDKLSETEPKLLGSDEAITSSVHPSRSKSTTCVEVPTVKVPMRTIAKSASENKMVVTEEEAEEVDRRRPATTRETTSFGGDEAVDERADDFINKFRQQLKLQRIDSILRSRKC